MEVGRQLATVAIALAAGITVGACGSADGRPYVYDTPLKKRIAQFRQEGPEGATRRLDSLTDFAWDTVHVFREGARYRDIDRAIGAELFGRDGRYYDNDGTLLIFMRDGNVALAQALIPPLLVEASATTVARSHATLRARTPDPGPYALDLLESPASRRP